MIGLVLVIKLHGRGCIVECSQQILLHVPDRCGTFCKTLQHKADMVCIQLHESAAHDLRRLVIPCHPQHSAFRRAGIHQQVHDLIDGVLLVRAEPEQEFYLQRLIKIILKLLPDAPGIDRVRIVPLCLILISLICLRFWLFQSCAFGSTRIAVWAILYLRFAPVRVNATSQLVPFQPEAVQGFSVFPFCLTSFFEKWV